jgi:hypothetical protein
VRFEETEESVVVGIVRDGLSVLVAIGGSAVDESSATTVLDNESAVGTIVAVTESTVGESSATTVVVTESAVEGFTGSASSCLTSSTIGMTAGF